MKQLALPTLLTIALTAGCGTQSPQRPLEQPIQQAKTESQAPAVNAVVVPIPSALGLDRAASEAVQTLANAPAFGGEAVGYGGQPVPAVAALRSLLAQPNAAAALTLVLEHGTLPAQLLALSGMYYADHAAFQQRLESYRTVNESVPVHYGGCMIGFEEHRVSELLSAPGAVQMRGPSESWQQWAKRNPGSKTLVFDIEGGGYPMSLAGR